MSFPDTFEISELSNGLILITYHTYNDNLPQMTNASLFVKLGSVDEILQCDQGIPNLLREYIATVYCPSLFTESTKLLTSYSGNAHNNIELAQILSNINKINTKITVDNNIFTEIKNMYTNNNNHHDLESKIYYKTIRKFYGGYNISRPVHGNKETINSIKITRFREYIRTYYKPQNYILFISSANYIMKAKDIEEYLTRYTPNIIKKTRSFTTYIPRYKEEINVSNNWNLSNDNKSKFKIKGKYVISLLFTICGDILKDYPVLLSIDSTRFIAFLFEKIIQQAIINNKMSNSIISISAKYEKLRNICLLNVIIQTKNNIRTTKNTISSIFKHKVSPIEAEAIIQEFLSCPAQYSLYEYNKEIATTYTIMFENNKLVPSIPHVNQYINDPNIIAELANKILNNGCSLYIIS